MRMLCFAYRHLPSNIKRNKQILFRGANRLQFYEEQCLSEIFSLSHSLSVGIIYGLEEKKLAQTI